MSNIEKELVILNSETIESMIYVIRGQKVMLDFELAKIYGYTTKAFNQQVKNNICKFDEDFRFQLTKEEWNEILMSKILTSSWGGNRKLPYAFTEQGIYMLMTVLKGELAVKQSKILIRTFKQMKDYIVENNQLSSVNEILKLSNQVKTNTRDIKYIKNQLEIVMDNFIDPNTYKHYLILDGEKIEADNAYQSLFKLANKSIYIIDDYIDIKTLQLLKSSKDNIDIIIFSDNKSKNNLDKNYINDFISETSININIKRNNNKFHDRYIIIDYNTNNEMIYHSGASIKDAGKSITTISKIEEKEVYKELIKRILNNENLFN